MLTSAALDSFMSEFLKKYGAFAFGLASLFLVWYGIAKPLISESKIDTASLSQMAEANRDTSLALKDTASALERIVTRLEIMSARTP